MALSGVELQLAYNSLVKLKKTLAYEESEEEADEPAEGDFERQIDMMLTLFESRLEGPQV
jgi:hypothetical protein